MDDERYGEYRSTTPPRDTTQVIAIGALIASVLGGVIYAFVAFGHQSGSDGSALGGRYQVGNGGYYAVPPSQSDGQGTEGGLSDATQPADGSSDTTQSTDTAGPTDAPADLQTYTGPGGISVQGPADWTSDSSAGLAAVADYDAPGSTGRLAGSTFRIGISNPNPISDFHAEAVQAANYLRSTFHASILSGPTFQSFLGTECADIQYQYFNTTYGLERRGVERIWHQYNQTYTIQSSGADTDWSQTRQVFFQLVASAAVD